MGWIACLAAFPMKASAQSDLTADQKTRLRAVMEDARRDTRHMYDQLRRARVQLGDLYKSYNLDERRIRDTVRWMNRIQNDLQFRHLQTQREIRRIVNPAQFEELKKNMREMHDRRGRGRERGPNRHRKESGDD
ncbi:MAG: hypothetical protein KY468_20795 [Armatimonadetes bacterium]|nr:hypothetical protein [Armatimonadota bacterium]